MTRREALLFCRSQLGFLAASEAEAESREAVSFVAGCEIPLLFAKSDEELSTEQTARLLMVVDQRKSGVPLAYVLGERWFYGMRFCVSPEVLIPRQETELLAEEAIRLIGQFGYSNVLDVCTGSGCIAAAIAKHTSACVFASDLSEDALQIAQQNALALGVPISFFCADLLWGVCGRFDLITANPPYIRSSVISTLASEVRDHEPRLALDGGADGLSLYRKLLPQAKEHLTSEGSILLEIGYDQGEAISSLLLAEGYREIRMIQDYSQRDRIVAARMAECLIN